MSRITAVVILVVLQSVLIAAAGPALASPAYAPETLLAGGPSAQDAPQCAPGIEAWQDGADDVWVGWTPVWAAVAAGPSVQRHPSVSGHVVVFEDDRGGDWDIYAWDTRQPADPTAVVPLATGPGDQLDPAASGTVVAYEDHSRGNADIAVYDLATGQTRVLTTNAKPQVDPATDGRWVAWADRRNGNWDVYAYDLVTGRLKRLTTNKAAQTAPQVGQGKVVYQDRRNGNWDVYLCSIATGKEQRLTSARSNQTQPQIDAFPRGSRTGNVVYVDDRRDAGDIWVREGRTGIHKPVCEQAGAQTSPSFADERVVWADARSGQSDVYAARLLFPSLTVPGSLTSDYAGSVKVTGRLYGERVDGQKVRVAGYGATRSIVVRGSGEDEGTYSLVVKRIVRKLKLRVWYPGDLDHLPAWGGTVTITPQAVLSRPRLVRTPAKPTNGAAIANPSRCTISGTLKPRHPAGTRAVTVNIFRKTKYTDWKLYKTLRLKVRNAGAASAYQTQLDLTSYFYSWKVQAVHKDAGHAETLSPFSVTLPARQ